MHGIGALSRSLAASAPGPQPGEMPAVGWEAWFDLLGGAALAALAVLPVAVLAVGALARRRRLSGSAPARAWRTSLADVGILGAIVAALWLTMAPGSRAGAVTGGVSLVPLADLATMGTFQVVGNLLLLAVPGFLLPLRFPGLASVPRVLAVAAAGSLLIETAQHVLMLDRVSSVDDVLLNTVGAGLAALLSRPWWRDAPAAPPESRPRPSTVDADHRVGRDNSREPRTRSALTATHGSP